MPPASGPLDRCAPNDRHSRSISDTQHAMDGSTCVCCGGPGCERAVVYGVIVRVKMWRCRVTHRSQLGCCGMAVCRRASQTRESAMVLAPGCVATNQACRSEFFSFTPLEGLRHRTSPPSGWRVGPSTQPPARRGDTLPVQRHPRTVATRRPTSHGDAAISPAFLPTQQLVLYIRPAARGGRCNHSTSVGLIACLVLSCTESLLTAQIPPNGFAQ